MKLYYNSLIKEEKKVIKKDFLNEENLVIYNKAKRLIFISIAGILFSIIFFFFDIYFKKGWVHYLIDALVFTFSAFALLFFRSIIINKINNYAIKKRDEIRKKTN